MVDRLIEGITRQIKEIKDKITFEKPKSVGSATVKMVEVDKYRDGCDIVILDIPDKNNDLFTVFGIPHGQFKAGERIEVLVRMEKPKKGPPVKLFSSFMDRVRTGVYDPLLIGWETAIRPYDRKRYGQIAKEDKKNLLPIFRQNSMDSKSHEGFMRRFMRSL